MHDTRHNRVAPVGTLHIRSGPGGHVIKTDPVLTQNRGSRLSPWVVGWGVRGGAHVTGWTHTESVYDERTADSQRRAGGGQVRARRRCTARQSRHGGRLSAGVGRGCVRIDHRGVAMCVCAYACACTRASVRACLRVYVCVRRAGVRVRVCGVEGSGRATDGCGAVAAAVDCGVRRAAGGRRRRRGGGSCEGGGDHGCARAARGRWW